MSNRRTAARAHRSALSGTSTFLGENLESPSLLILMKRCEENENEDGDEKEDDDEWRSGQDRFP